MIACENKQKNHHYSEDFNRIQNFIIHCLKCPGYNAKLFDIQKYDKFSREKTINKWKPHDYLNIETTKRNFTVAIISIFIEVKLSILDMNGKLEVPRRENLVNVSYVFRKICILHLLVIMFH